MSKIMIISNSLSGLYKFRKELISKLIADNNEVIIVSPINFEYKKYLIYLGCKIINIDVNRRSKNIIHDIKLFLKYKKTIKLFKPDMVITYTIKPNIYAGYACRKLKVPYYSNITGLGSAFQAHWLVKRFIIFLYKNALKNVLFVFFQNEENLKIFIDNNIIRNQKAIITNGSGVNLNEFKFSMYPSIEDDKIKFLFMGRIMKEKGIDELLYTARKIKNIYNNIEFIILGNYEEDYKPIIDKHVNESFIKYCGYQKDVKQFIESSHCIILPSYHEGMSNTLLEAAAIGRPIITTNISGCKEAVINEETGYLCNVKDAEDLFLKTIKFIELDFETKKSMGLKARKLAEERFDRDKVVEKICQLINI